MKQRGITLVEMMITLVILAILAALALPSWQSYARGDRIVKQTNEMNATIMLMRAEAMRTGRHVVMCPVAKDADLSATSLACADATSFSTGAIMFTDHNRNGAYEAKNDEIIDYVRPPSDVTIASATKTIQLDNRGLSASGTGYKLVICGDDGDIEGGRIVSISAFGRPATTAIPAGGNCRAN